MHANSQLPLFLPLGSKETTFELVGGKGHSLTRLMNLKAPVPQGFQLTTEAYRRFIDANDLQAKIVRIIGLIDREIPGAIDRAAADIQALFAAGTLPIETGKTLHRAYTKLGGDITADGPPAVAVRSSATAEDLPEMSFAGQQDTYLNVVGEEALQVAVRDCWASLWTARAISYRERMGLDHRLVTMGVVVQKMISADVSGILFTANPATGNRSEMVINASYGLGAAIVGGHVTPDSYVVDRHTGNIKEMVIGSKKQMIVSAGKQGTITQAISESQRRSKALSADMIQTLVDASASIERHFNAPQDIEWALADNRYWILQARPITNLPALPLTDMKWAPPRPGARLIRRQVVEHMPGPLSPLFDELYLRQGLEQSMKTFLEEFEVALDLGQFLHLPFFVTVNGYAYTSVDIKCDWKVIPVIVQAYVKLLPRMLRQAIARWQDDKLPAYLTIIERWKKLDPATAAEAQLWSGMQALSTADAFYWFAVSVILGMSKVTDNLLNSFLVRFGKERGLTSGLFLRGFPSKTLTAQVTLETIANTLRASPVLRELVLKTPAANLMETLQKKPDARAVRKQIQSYLETYGHRIYTLDFAEPTAGEDPVTLLLSLKALVQSPADSSRRQAELARNRDMLAETIAQSFEPLKRWCFRRLLSWARKYGPYREEALFYIGAAWPTLRSLAHELGQRMTAGNILRTPDDIYYLRPSEVESALAACAAGQALPDFKKRTQARRELREARKQLDPPAKIPALPFKFGPLNLSLFETQKLDEDEHGNLKGFAVSPGKVTAPATVIRSPDDFGKMQPGTILVCPTATPAWTPLFSQAKGLVTEIGSILAHGSIVAREYDIPAVMGVGHATHKIKDGQMLTVDGNRGLVKIVE
jgi:phosphohistidine swiveling domain-containing protein